MLLLKQLDSGVYVELSQAHVLVSDALDIQTLLCWYAPIAFTRKIHNPDALNNLCPDASGCPHTNTSMPPPSLRLLVAPPVRLRSAHAPRTLVTACCVGLLHAALGW